MAKLDILLTDGDITFSNGDIDLVAGVDQVKQELLILLKLFREEWFADTDAGVPYYQQILDRTPAPDGTQQAPSSQLIESTFRAEILSVDSVEAITLFDLVISNTTRHATIDFVCSTSEGVVSVSEVFP